MRKLFIFILVFILSACSTHLADITVISNKNINLQNVNLDKSLQRRWAKGEDSKFTFLFIPLGTPQIKEAINQTLKNDGDLIVDGSIYYKYWWFIVGQRTIEVQGNVIKTRKDN